MTVQSAKPAQFVLSSQRGDPWAVGLRQALKRRGIDARTAENVVRPGEDWAERLRLELADSDALVVVVPPDGPPSTWQNTEAGAAMAFGKPVIVVARDGTPEAAVAELRLQRMISAATPEDAAAQVEAAALAEA